MTVVSLKAENSQVSSSGTSTGEGFPPNGVVELGFSDGSSLLFSIDYLPDEILPEQMFALWESGRELSSGDEEALRFAAACYGAERIALRLIARAEQNNLGLVAKLQRRGYEAAVAKAVVTHLLDRNLLDDGRYAELWIRSRLALGKPVSPQWLLAALGKRGIDRNSSLKALEKVLDPEAEYALLLRYLGSRSFREKTWGPQGKEARYLRAQLKHDGFSFEILDKYFND